MTLAQRLALLKGNRNSNPNADGTTDGRTDTECDEADDGGIRAAPLPAPASATVPLVARLQRLYPHGGSDGSRNTSPRTKHSDAEVAARLRGEVAAPGLIQTLQTIPLASRHGRVVLSEAARAPLAALGLSDRALPDGLLFLDTETTGLAGGTGTLPFMVCLARIQGEQLQLGQWILTGFSGEAALLQIAGSWIKPAAHLVSYNGKSFDVPLLVTRYRLARQADPFANKAHIDLLHLTRRACGHGWDDCRLQTAERRLLGFMRENDFPSHLIPQAWSDFVRGGGVESLNAIAEHNRHDVLSLAALLATIARIYAEPGHEAAHPLKIAQSHAIRGNAPHAIDHLTRACRELDEAALLFLAKLHRQQGQDEQALAIWRQLRQNNCVAGIEALTKYQEHVTRELEAALELAEALVRLEPGNELHARRRDRLEQRLARPKA
jgi:uncharacterized protein YprB with RNaseH-like and TPR domain